MINAKVCPFCKETRFINNKNFGLPVDECILYESEDLYIGVDISPLVRGHVLIITKEHYYNFYELPRKIKNEVIELQKELKRIYKEMYNSEILFFEHGSNEPGMAGSSIDHAHLHCIPYDGDIKEDLDKLLGEAIECDIMKEDDFTNEFSYIYIDVLDDKYIYKVDKLDSQFLRRLIITRLKDKEYKWQNRCKKEKSVKALEQTIKDLKGKVSIPFY